MRRGRPCVVLFVTIAMATASCGTRVDRREIATPGMSPATEATAATQATVADAPTSASVGATASPAGRSVVASGSSAATGEVAARDAGRSANPSGGMATGGSGAAAGGASGPASPGVAGPRAGAPLGPDGSATPKTEIRIGEIGMFSGPIGTGTKPISDAVRIWVRWINDRGGISGHPVVLQTGDSGGDPARHRALVQQMVESGVMAFVGQAGDVLSGSTSVDYLTQRRVPVVGSEGAASWYYESPVFFPQIQHSRPLLQALAVGAAKEGRSRGKSTLAVWTCVEVQICKEVDEVVPKITARYGVRVVNSTKISIGQPDFTAECLNSRKAGAEMIFVAADGLSISRGAASCARQGYRPTWVLVGATILAEQHAEDPNLIGAIGVDTQAPWFLDNTPPRKEWRDAVARYASGLSTTSSSMIGWVAAKLFEYAMRRAPQPFTREGLLASLWSIRGDPLADLTVPLLFAAEKPATPTTCFWNVTPKDGRWFSADGGQRHCFDYDPNV
jgi:branched-chain amino acid transport system substrate-binding protein